MSAPSTDALDLLRFLALSLELHTDALCCAVNDVEAAIVESSINDELMDRLEDELAVLLDRQRRLHAGQAMIALSQKERLRGSELRRDRRPLSQLWGDKRIQTSRSQSRAASTVTGTGSVARSPRQSTVDMDLREEFADDVSTRCLSSIESSLEADVASVDRQVDLLKSKIEELDRYSLRGKLLQLEKMKKSVKGIDLEALVEIFVENFEFPPAVKALWTPNTGVSSSSPSATVSASFVSSSSSPSVAPHCTPPRSTKRQNRSDITFAQHATGKGDVVNHTNVDLLLARACQRLAGRSVDALEALTSTNVSEESTAAHVLGCMVYAGEFDRSSSGELHAVMELLTMPQGTLTRLYRRWENESVCKAKLDARCFGARGTVLAAQDFNALPADWATTQSLSRVPLDEVLPPIRHLLSARFTFASVAELKHLQATRVALQRKVVQFLLGSQETSAELLRQAPNSDVDNAVASARLAVAENIPDAVSGYAWKTIVHVPREV